MDAVDDPSRVEALERHVRALDLPFFRISAVVGTGIDDLLEAAWRQIAAVRAVPPPAVEQSDDDWLVAAKRTRHDA